MKNALESSLIRLLKADGSPVGMGFFVTERLAISCAHVVAAALGMPNIPKTAPEAGIQMDFPLIAPGQTVNAQVVAWNPPSANGSGDIVGLELVDPLPENARPAQLVVEGDLWGHSFRAFGCPRGYDMGVWASGRIMAMDANGWLQVEDIKTTGHPIAPGFSGGPIWDDDLGEVVGMVVAADQPELRAAYGLPVKVITSAWPILTEKAIPACPYRGLFAFRERDAALFFGREVIVNRLVEAVRDRSLVAVVGPSGSGKSSVVFAGLVARLRTLEGQPDGVSWQIADFRPGAHPFKALAQSLLPTLEAEMTETDRLIETDKLGKALNHQKTALSDVVKRILQKNDQAKRLLLVADQFEELYTLCPDEAIRRQFIDMLLSALEPDCGATLVLTLRADFLGQALSHRPFADALQNADLKLGPMNEAELLRAIEQPALARGVAFEVGLAQRILDAVQGQPGDLPLLEFTLTELWKLQEGQHLTHTAYGEVGEVRGALAQYADRIYTGLPGEQKDQVRHIFTQLVRPGLGTEDTRRQATQAELGDESWELVRRLANDRLVVTEATPSGEQAAEIVHEALIQDWGQLKSWMAADREFRAWQERLRADLEDWRANNEDEGALLRGAPLAEAEDWLERRGEEVGEAEIAYIRASLAFHQRELDEREAQHRHELEQAHRLASTQRQRTLVLAIGLAIVIGLTLVVLYLYGQSNRNLLTARQNAATATAALGQSEQRGTLAATNLTLAQTANAQSAASAATAKAEAQSRATQQAIAQEQARRARAGEVAAQAKLVLDTYPQRSLLLNVEALRIIQGLSPGVPAAREALFSALGQFIMSHPLVGHEGPITTLAFSPDGHWLATGSEDNTARLWDLTKADPYANPLVLRGHKGPIFTLAFSPDGHWLATGSEDNTARLWDLTATDPSANPLVLRGHKGPIFTLAFSPDGHWLATGGADAIARLWDLTAADPSANPLALRGHWDNIYTLAFSKDGHWLATGSGDATARLWDLTAADPPANPLVLSGHKSYIYTLAFSPDGHWLATGSNDHTARLWDLTAANPSANPLVLHGHEGGITSLAFSSDGHWLATGSWDNTAWLWDLTAADPSANPLVLRGHEDRIGTLAFSPDGHWLATGSWDNTARLWDLTAANPATDPLVLVGHEGPIYTLAFSKNGHWLATGSDDAIARLWDLTTANPAADPLVLRGHEGSIETLAFSQDGHWLATGSDDHTARLWDLTAANPAFDPLVLRGHEKNIETLAFSPDRHWLATGSWDNTARLWDLTAADPSTNPLVLRGHDSIISALAFSPDGHWLATGSGDATIRLWDLTAANPAANPLILRGLEYSIDTLAFSPDGHWLATGSNDYTAWLWDLTAANPSANPLALRGHVGPIYALAFSPDGHWLATGSQDYTARLWDLTAADPSANPLILRHEDWIVTLAFSPDGHWLATGSWDHTARLWDLTTANPAANPLVLRGHVDRIRTLAFSEDVHWLATGSYDHTARLWDLTAANPAADPLVLVGHEAPINTLAFSPDGHWLATGSDDHTARLWLLNEQDMMKLACQIAGRNLTQAEWQQYFSGEIYRKTCPQWDEGK